MEKVTAPKNYKEKVESLKKLNPQTKWEDIHIGDVFHIPGIWMLSSKDILIKSMLGNKLEAEVISTKKEMKFDNGSVFSKIMVKKKTF